MNCRRHPDRPAASQCQRHHAAFCLECTDAAACPDPGTFCRYRLQCIVWEITEERSAAPGPRRQGAGGG